jgi:hypothetical protein
VRPPESVTEQEKAASMAAYGDTGAMGAYEYDHFVPLELGGATNDPRNLWPEPGGSPNPKDVVEDSLRRAVCDGQITLARAQREIAKNWISFAVQRPKPHSHAAAVTGKCTVTASYNARYHDYDVYVRSNQPDPHGHGHRRRRPLGHLAYRWRRIRRCVLPCGHGCVRAAHHGARGNREVLHNALATTSRQ